MGRRLCLISYAKNLAIGAFAVGDIAIGDQIKAIVGGYKTSGSGDKIFNLYKDKDKVIPAIKQVYPNLSYFKLWIVEKLMNLMI